MLGLLPKLARLLTSRGPQGANRDLFATLLHMGSRETSSAPDAPWTKGVVGGTNGSLWVIASGASSPGTAWPAPVFSDSCSYFDSSSYFGSQEQGLLVLCICSPAEEVG